MQRENVLSGCVYIYIQSKLFAFSICAQLLCCMLSARTLLEPAPRAGLAMIALVPAAQLFANT